MAATSQELALEVANAIKGRGLRLGHAMTTDEPAVFVTDAGVAVGTVTTGETWVTIKFKNSLVTDLDEKISGIKNKTGVAPT